MKAIPILLILIVLGTVPCHADDSLSVREQRARQSWLEPMRDSLFGSFDSTLEAFIQVTMDNLWIYCDETDILGFMMQTYVFNSNLSAAIDLHLAARAYSECTDSTNNEYAYLLDQATDHFFHAQGALALMRLQVASLKRQTCIDEARNFYERCRGALFDAAETMHLEDLLLKDHL